MSTPKKTEQPSKTCSKSGKTYEYKDPVALEQRQTDDQLLMDNVVNIVVKIQFAFTLYHV